ncbi:MAG: MotA/TolQ/ExbB proton channel family protein [Eubacterium sp.]|nr:MotA/TolQ/ExbB proton channel family protein [Eubacterium sp.]
MKVNITWIIGFVMMAVLVFLGMLDGGEMRYYWDWPSVQITVGGTLGAMIASTPFEIMKNVGKLFKFAILPPKFDAYKTIDDMVAYATTARSKGLLALEESANKAADPFMRQALMLIIDANDPDKVREMLENAMDSSAERHSAATSFFSVGVAMGPAFGMIGTLVGLIIMLNEMAENPDNIGTAMAIAIITTFYGSLLANVVLAPLEKSLKDTHASEELCKNMVLEGVMAIAAGANPRFIREKLEFMLPRSEVEKRAAKAGAAAPANQ